MTQQNLELANTRVKTIHTIENNRKGDKDRDENFHFASSHLVDRHHGNRLTRSRCRRCDHHSRSRRSDHRSHKPTGRGGHGGRGRSILAPHEGQFRCHFVFTLHTGKKCSNLSRIVCCGLRTRAWILAKHRTSNIEHLQRSQHRSSVSSPAVACSDAILRFSVRWGKNDEWTRR